MKTRSSILLVLACLICTYVAAAPVKENRPVTQFNKISSSSGIDVVFVQGDTHSLVLEAEAENLPKIETKIENGTLILKKKDNEQFKRFASNNNKITVYVSAKNLEEINVSGGADFDCNNLNNNTQLRINASGGADVEINTLNTKACGFSFSGGADCDIKNLTTQTAALNFSGGSDAEIHFSSADNVDLNISGGSDATLSGKVKNINVNSSGGSDADVRSLSYENINAIKSGGGDIKK